MSQSKADRILSRITALHHSLQLDKDESGPSALERDLMLGYLRELYDLYLNAGEAQQQVRKQLEKTDPKPPPPPPPPAPAPKPEPAPEPVKVAPPPPPVPEAPVPPPPAPAYAEHTAKIDPEYSRPAPNPPQPAPQPNLSPDVEALFKEVETNGFSSRRMQPKVNDLTRALSINNRVLFSNTLFRNNEELNLALKELNLKGSFGNARAQLIDLAQHHHWTDEERQETAREFIDLVRRRYV
ncbi:type IV secretory pathway VirB10-like protein [Lewinella aquimaris]|uniref:Type IV secretory pathway VirB10-like protein n=1 Tax=Neolewinella aquimaris TaxID=1835722 RepID=A0A840E0Z6_9BACT|nr:hypothetical protein [Neolewinella aquimaris]MBB4078800.1 type IV secretory pathway VirB10-like protein [Neolewinella aquimaris]